MKVAHPEALLFCFVWAATAVLGWWLRGTWAGLALSVGLFVVLMPASAIILTRTGDFARERMARWGILGAAALLAFLLFD